MAFRSDFAALCSAALVAVVLLVSCGDSDGDQELDQSGGVAVPAPMDGGEDAVEQNPAESTETEAADHVAFPETAAADAAEYVVEVINAEQESSPQDWEDRLHEQALEELSPVQLAEVINSSIRPGGPWQAVDYQGTELESVTRLEGRFGELNLQISVDPQDQQIITLFFGEAPAQLETAESFQEIEERLAQLPGQARALILQDDEPLLQLGAGEPAPLASTAKLYVLLATVEAIEAGDSSWGETMEVTDELRSLPSGTLQDQPDGYQTTLYDVAHRMIEISDNTATDMLIDHVGRDAVEQAVADSGHHAPELMRPFLTTRELFQLRWGHPELGQEWANAQEQARRDVLDELAQSDMEIESEDVGADDVDYAIDWHASAFDVATVHQELARRAEDHPELGSILGRNPGLSAEVEDPWWQSMAYKGGSLPGVLTGSWHAIGEDGQERTVVLLVEHDDASELRDESQELFSLATDALTIED